MITKDRLKELRDSDLIYIWNEYCYENRQSYDLIYPNDADFFETHFTNDLMELARAISFGEYNYRDEYVYINVYGNLFSFNMWQLDDHIDFEALLEWLNDEDEYEYRKQFFNL
jgi:hypothetical protein